jgi:hypothetical protein
MYHDISGVTGLGGGGVGGKLYQSMCDIGCLIVKKHRSAF